MEDGRMVFECPDIVLDWLHQCGPRPQVADKQWVQAHEVLQILPKVLASASWAMAPPLDTGHINVCVFQEIHLGAVAFSAFKARARREGYHSILAPGQRDASGRIIGGLAILSRRPIGRLVLPRSLHPYRCLH